MGHARERAVRCLSFLALWLSGCAVNVGGGTHEHGDAASAGGTAGAGTFGDGAAPSGQGGSGNGTAGGATTGGPGLLPARIRRLTNAEFDASVKTLLKIDSTYGQSFTPDTRQDGFTRNDAQRVDPVFATQVDDAAQKIAAAARSNVMTLAPCANAAGSEACARTFLTSFAAQAYRRPATQREIDALFKVYQAGADGAAYADGIQATIQAVLESPGFLYITEIGETPLAPMATLTQYEIASSISYLVTGAPPDQTLLDAAKGNMLATPDARQAQVERLLGSDAAKAQVTRLVEEWLGIDRITETAKDSNVYKQYADLHDSMKKEADDFTAEVMWKSGGSVSDLLSADWTIADDALARMYLNLSNGATVPKSGNHVSLTGVRRRGILDQGAFLSVFAHANESGPVLRGVAVLRRVVCARIDAPSSLNINVVPPLPDLSKTTRQRFTAHVADPVCAQCHNKIDPVGFTFENLDGMGRERPDENGLRIDSSTTIADATDYAGNYTDSSALALALGKSPTARSCFARKTFRFAATRSDDVAADAEYAFMTTADALPSDAQGKVKQILTAFVRSGVFITRKASQ